MDSAIASALSAQPGVAVAVLTCAVESKPVHGRLFFSVLFFVAVTVVSSIGSELILSLGFADDTSAIAQVRARIEDSQNLWLSLRFLANGVQQGA
jgi:ABC-type sugar transport system permease subunit